MSEANEQLAQAIAGRFGDDVTRVASTVCEVTFEVVPERLIEICTALRDEPDFHFEQLIDVCGVDYLGYADDQWKTIKSRNTGFSRAVDRTPVEAQPQSRRFAVVYHLLSVQHNRRLRLRVFCADPDMPMVDSVNGVWPVADWFEREAFDLFGIIFNGHPDLRRILTDYGFIGHPFRKDFPLIGNVEVRYDPERGRVVYQPVTIEPRVLEPRVIRKDHQFVEGFKDA
ncbi:MAG TPA: NADH-quinone oxidoreductase subunit C [Gammaproteobacteria bacterium]|nr:NADH-quinone oxidoreductase subunit C [Gammaproteobacteria bacterium]